MQEQVEMGPGVEAGERGVCRDEFLQQDNTHGGKDRLHTNM
jgi:hypothetical protein